jgi:phosphoribosyl 1,2-cyclic phosphodiesterase
MSSGISFSLLSSGSRGNALYLTDGSARILIDCGISARELTRRLESIEVTAESLDAILITHEHSDHVSGLPVFGRKVRCPVYANEKTLRAMNGMAKNQPVRIFVTREILSFGDLKIESFPVPHDAVDPVGFRVSKGKKAVAIATDIGSVGKAVLERISDVDALVIETNHDPDLLWEAPYPWALKERIFGPDGHLSNQAAGKVVEKVTSETACRLRVLVGAHVSEKSNYPELAEQELFSASSHLEKPPKIAIASARRPTEVFTV